MRLLLLMGLVWMSMPAWTFVDEVNNGRRPKDSAQTLHFTIDLSFGADEAEDTYLWPHPGTTVGADAAGNFYVADPAGGRVLAFDPQGKFLRTVAAKGEGPGEFQNLFNFTLLTDGGGIGFEAQQGAAKFKYFDKDFLYKDEKSVSGKGIFLISATLSPKDNGFGGIYVQLDQASQSMKFKTGIFDMESNSLKELSSADRPAPEPARFSDPDYLAHFLGGNLKVFFNETGYYNYDQQGTLYTAVSSRYEITKWNADLSQPLMVVKRDYKPIANPPEQIEAMSQSFIDMMRGSPMASIMTDTTIRKAMEYAEPPPTKNPIFGIIPMEKGMFLVVHDVDLVKGVNRADIFTAQGEFLGSAMLSGHAFVYFLAGGFFPRMVFKNGFAYSVTCDDMGDNRVVRYKYFLGPP